MSTESAQDVAAAAAEKMSDAAGAAADEASPAGDAVEDLLGVGGEGREWSFLMKAAVAVVVIIVCLIATRVIRGETPEEKRQRLRKERRAKKKAAGDGPDEIDRLLSSIVRRAPGQAPPPGSIPISGRGVPRGMPPGGAGRGAGPTGAAAMRAAAAARAAAGGRGNGAGPAAGGRGGPPPPGGDNRPKLRWNQTNEEVEIVIRVDPKVARSDVKVEVTGTVMKLSLRNQTVIAGHLFMPVDPEGCTWQIDNPGPGYPKEVTITLLKAEPAKSKEQWWRAPLKGLEQQRQPAPTKPADPEMVRKAIAAIKAKQAAGGGAKLGAKPGSGSAVAGPGRGQPAAPGNAAAANGTPGGATAPPGAAAKAPAAAATAAASQAGAAGAGGGDAGAAVAVAGAPVAAATPSKAGKSGGKKKNRKKK